MYKTFGAQMKNSNLTHTYNQSKKHRLPTSVLHSNEGWTKGRKWRDPIIRNKRRCTQESNGSYGLWAQTPKFSHYPILDLFKSLASLNVQLSGVRVNELSWLTNFAFLRSFDAQCGARTNSRLFSLEYIRGGELAARANIWYGPQQTFRHPR